VADGSANLDASAITFTDLGTVTTVDINGGSVDGATIGAAAQSSGKFTTLSGSSTLHTVSATFADTVAASGSITAGTSFIIGSADLNEVDMEKLDGITNGTAANNKALVLDGSAGATGLGALGIASMASNWTNASRTVADMGIVTTMDLNGGSIDGTVIGAAAQAAAEFTTVSGSGAFTTVGSATIVGNLDTSGSVKLAGVPDTAAAVASDSLYFLDSDGLMKRESMVDYAAAIAGVGLVASAGALALSLDELSAGVVDVANDSFAIVDANDSNISKKESIVDFVAAIAGAGITATNGVLSSDASPTPNNIGNASASMVEGFNYSSVVFDAVRTWTCPASPDAGDKVVVKAPSNASAYALTVLRAGSQTIDGEVVVVMNSDNGAITLTYLGSDKWAIS
jgi:hypothetical protein